MKRIFNITKICLIISVLIIATSKSVIKEQNVTSSVKNSVDLTAMAKKISEFHYDALYSTIDTYTGDLTGYIYNCPLCGGHLACASNYNIMDGTTTYPDPTYGTVQIVASSKNLPCGTIIRFENERISDETIYAIVLDRGVRGNAIDFLSPSYDYAVQLGRSTITYDVVRNGWE